MVTRIAILMALALGACGAGDSADAGRVCPHDLPSSCPSPAPTYAAQVSGVIAQRCAICHMPGGAASDRPYQTYDQVFAIRADILSQVSNCEMPPPDAGALSSDERAALEGWLVCGAPND